MDLETDSVDEGSTEAIEDESERVFICLKCRKWITGAENYAKHNEENHSDQAVLQNSIDEESDDEVLEEAMQVEEVEESPQEPESDNPVPEIVEPELMEPEPEESEEPAVVEKKVVLGKNDVKETEIVATKKRKLNSKQAKITDFLGATRKSPRKGIKVEDVKVEKTVNLEDEDDEDISIDESPKPASNTSDANEPSSEVIDVKAFKDESESSEEEASVGEEQVFITEQEYADSFRFDPEKFGFEDSILDKAFTSYVRLVRCDEKQAETKEKEATTPVKAKTPAKKSIPKGKKRVRQPKSIKAPVSAPSKKKTPLKKASNPKRVPNLNKSVGDDREVEADQKTSQTSSRKRRYMRRT